MAKKMMDHSCGSGILASAAGYATNTNPGPAFQTNHLMPRIARCEKLTAADYFIHAFALLVSQVAERAEHADTGEDACKRIGQ